MNERLLEIKDLNLSFTGRENNIQVLRGVDLYLNNGEILGIVGESGSGKSVLMKSVMDILPENARLDQGQILFKENRIDNLSEKQKRLMRGKEMTMIFQDPMTALNPLKTIGYHLVEIIKRHDKNCKTKQAQAIAIEKLRMVGIPTPEKRMKQYPHEFSGGMRQRVLIAMALCFEPQLLIADEPTTALDVTIQAQILKLLKTLQDKLRMSIILITHDLGVVASTCTRIVVMYGGQIMEEGTTEEIFYQPKHPYTKALLNAIPKVEGNGKQRLQSIPGAAPSFTETIKGCPFAKRCGYAVKQCFESIPEYKEFSCTQRAKCFFAGSEGLDETV